MNPLDYPPVSLTISAPGASKRPKPKILGRLFRPEARKMQTVFHDNKVRVARFSQVSLFTAVVILTLALGIGANTASSAS